MAFTKYNRPDQQLNYQKLELKRFNGRPTDWQAFIDCFDSVIHSNPKLNNIDKMNYLKSLVEGPAASAIKGLPLTSANYKMARDILEQRYGNKQLIISAHMDNLLKLPVISSVTVLFSKVSLIQKIGTLMSC